jgi:hypothetical protein
MLKTTKLVLACVIACAGCSDDPKKKAGTTDAVAAEQLTLAIEFEGGELVEGVLPPGTSSAASLAPFTTETLTPGADALLGFEVVPVDARPSEALVQFGDADDHFVVDASAFMDDATDAGTASSRRITLGYKVAASACRKLCDRQYELQVTQALRVNKQVTKHAKSLITLDCSDDGDHAQCGAADEQALGADASVVSDRTRDGATQSGRGDASVKPSPAEVAAGACDNSAMCTGMEAYTSCVQTMCDAQYRTCMGDNYRQGDFTGSPCEAFLTCTTNAPDPCNADCTQDAECQDCLTNVGQCATACISLLDCGAGSLPEGGLDLPDASVPNIDLNKTCDDLSTCCASLPSAEQASCESTLTQLRSFGDAACASAYASYCP